MGIIYTKHLEESISLRDINKAGVNYLKVIVAEEGFDIVVITAYWFAKARLKV